MGAGQPRAQPLLVSFPYGKSAQAPPTLCFSESKIPANFCSLKGSPVCIIASGLRLHQSEAAPGSCHPAW